MMGREYMQERRGRCWRTTGGFGKRWDLLEGEFEPNGDGLGLDRS